MAEKVGMCGTGDDVPDGERERGGRDIESHC